MATVYISQAGDDTTGAGTSVSPWKTISKAATSSSAGDTIYCLSAGGTFTWVTQTFASNRYIVGDGASLTIFDGGSVPVTWRSPAVITISGIAFQNVVQADNGTGRTIFMPNGGTSQFIFNSCLFKLLTPTFNQFWGVFGSMFGSVGAQGGMVFVACTFWNMWGAGGGMLPTVFSVDSGTTVDFAIRNCTLYSDVASGDVAAITNLSAGNTIEYKNNIVVNANGVSTTWARGSEANIGSNNLFRGYTSPPSLSSQLSSDPLFVDAASGNFNLRPTSPCIDAGVII